MQEKKIFTKGLPSPYDYIAGYVDEDIFVIGNTGNSIGGEGIILESNNGINWAEIKYPETLGSVTEFGSNDDGEIIVKFNAGSAFNNYFLDNIKSGPPYIIRRSSADVDYILNTLGYFSYYKKSNGFDTIYYKQSAGSNILSYTVPQVGFDAIPNKSYFRSTNVVNNGNTIYYTKSNWWGNYGTKNLLEIPGFTTLDSDIFEAKDITGSIQFRNLAFAFANNFTKILKINPSSTSVEPVFELIDCITPIPANGSSVQAIISNNGEIWANWGNQSNQTTDRLFSPNFGGEWFNLPSLNYETIYYRFYSSSNGKNQLYSPDINEINVPISINYGR